MKQKPKLLSVLAGIPCLISLLGGLPTATATTVYFNDFGAGAASLNGLSIVDESLAPGSSVNVVSGQVRIEPVSVWNVYVVANTASFAAPYSSILRNNPGTVT